MKSHYHHIEEKLNQRKSENAFRELQVNDGLVDFCSNDYLGFSTEKEIHEVYNINQYGATGSRLISGNTNIHLEVEKFLANYYHSQASLIFNSGYNANVGIFSCIPQRNDTIIYDELIHASIRDGIRLSNANSYSFKHNDLNSLREKIALSKGDVYVAVESIYSMDGDEAPLNELVELCEELQVALMVDEAHAVGVFGNKGEGLVAQYKLEDKVFARVITFGKAYGCHGAAVLVNETVRDYLINFSRPFIYTTAIPIHSVIAIKQAHEFLQSHIERLDLLKTNITHFKTAISKISNQLIESDSPIQCLIVSSNEKVKALANLLQQNGFDVRAILSPTVPNGAERIRICIHSFNNKNEIDNMVSLILETL